MGLQPLIGLGSRASPLVSVVSVFAWECVLVFVLVLSRTISFPLDCVFYHSGRKWSEDKHPEELQPGGTRTPSNASWVCIYSAANHVWNRSTLFYSKEDKTSKAFSWSLLNIALTGQWRFTPLGGELDKSISDMTKKKKCLCSCEMISLDIWKWNMFQNCNRNIFVVSAWWIKKSHIQFSASWWSRSARWVEKMINDWEVS